MSGHGSAALRWLAVRWLRRRWLAVIPLLLVVVVGTTGTMVALAAAQRTSGAYRDYLERADVGDVVINPALNTREIDDVIRSLPGVELVTTATFLFLTNDEGAPRSRYEVEFEEGPLVFVVASADGRFADMDRPAVREGRLPTGPSEAALSVSTAEVLGLEVGDVMPLAFWEGGVIEGLGDDELAAYLSEVVEPIGVERVEVVGIVTLADEVLPDDLYLMARVILSPDLAERYECQLGDLPPRGATREEMLATFFPTPCASNYRYYSLSLADGSAGVKPALDEFVRSADELMRERAESGGASAADGIEVGYYLIASETDHQRQAVERAIRPTVAALVVLGLCAAAITITLAGLIVVRELRVTRSDQGQWHQLGIGRAARAVVVGSPPAIAIAAGLVVGLVAGWLLDVGPVGLVRAVEPRADRRVNGAGVTGAVGIAVASLVVVVIAATTGSARRAGASVAAPGVAGGARRLARRAGSPAIADGLRAAYGHRATAPAVGVGAVLSAAVLAATVFGTSLSALVSTPRSYGWPWDLAVTTGAGYSGDLDLERAAEMLDAEPDVERWAALAFLSDISLDGEPMPAVIGLDRTTDVELAVLAGELPRAPGEVAVGARTAAERDLDIGDEVVIAGFVSARIATVTGIVVFPVVGQFQADRVGTGTGLLVPEEMLDPGVARQYAAFVGVQLRPGADAAAGERIVRHLASLDPENGMVHPNPVRPPEIVDARSTLAVPLTAALVVAALAVVALAFASWASVRTRRGELAVLRTLGFSNMQVRQSVWVHSLATVSASMLIGIPLGVIAGRLLWRGFANQMGVVPDPAGAWFVVLIAGAGGVVVAFLTAQWPSRSAVRMRPAEGLRSE